MDVHETLLLPELRHVPPVICSTVRCASSYAATTGTSGATATLLAFCPGNSNVRQVRPASRVRSANPAEECPSVSCNEPLPAAAEKLCTSAVVRPIESN